MDQFEKILSYKGTGKKSSLGQVIYTKYKYKMPVFIKGNNLLQICFIIDL